MTPRRTTSPGLLMFDIEGPALKGDEIRRLSHPLAGGVVLFARNFRSRGQLGELIFSIREICPQALIATDHEGGRGQQLRGGGLTALPAMRMLGVLWERDAERAVRAAIDTGYVLASELLACGIDMSFSPVLDLDAGLCGAIGDRAFHRAPRVVTALAQGVCHGMAIAGMASCGKHFPGHGHVEVDGNGGIPVDRRSLEEILSDDAAPFGWMGLGLSSVMPAYVTFPEVDPMPAGLSRVWLTDILRGRLGFSGAILAEDLGMDGLASVGGVSASAQAALAAGCDMLVLCNRPEHVDGLLAALRPEAMPDAGASKRRIEALRPKAPHQTWEQLQEDERHRAAVEGMKIFDSCP